MKPWHPQCYTKVHASDSLGNNSQLKKFLLEGLKYILEHKVIFLQRGGTWKERPDDIGLGTRDCIIGWLQSWDLELKIEKKKNATLKPEICESQILSCACSRELGTCKPLDGFFGDARWKA